MEERLHVAFLSEAAPGHLNPMLELSSLLVPLGFSISLLIPQKTLSKMNSDSELDHVHFIPLPVDFHMVMTPESEQLVEATLNALDLPVKCIVSDFFLGWTQDLANRMGIPRVAIVSCNAMTDAISCHIPLLHSKGYIPVQAQCLEDVNSSIDFIPGMEPFHPRMIPMFFRNSDRMGMILTMGRNFERVKEAACVLVNTVEELEQQVVLSRRSELVNYLPVGPLILHNSPDDRTRHHCLDWLDKQAPATVLYIAFGSMASLPPENIEKIAEGVKASGQPFLWAIRRDFARDAPENFYASLTNRFTNGQGLVIEWAPQMQVLQHPSVGGFLTHCGWNSTLEALWSGVPTVCWPCSAEQNLNAYNMVENWKIGLHLAEGGETDVSEEVIKVTVEAVMNSEKGTQMRNKAQQLKGVVRGANAKGGSSALNLQQFEKIIRDVKK